MVGALPRMRPVEHHRLKRRPVVRHARDGCAGPPAAAPAPIRLTDVDLGRPGAHRYRPGGVRTGCSAADWWPARSCWWAGSPASARAPCSCRPCSAWRPAACSTLLVSGEESAAQVKLRSARLSGDGSGLRLLTETQTEVGGGRARAPQAGRVRGRLGADPVVVGGGFDARLGGPDPRRHRAAPAGGQGQRHRSGAGRTRHQGR